MKKTQVALAALALVASSAAMADGVTISGNLDAGVANTSTGQASLVAGQGPTGADIGTYFSGAGGFVAGNNLNFSGSEDLGGGLKASFTLGMGLDLGNGSFGNGGSAAAFTQQANIGLSGDFGSVKAGMQLSPFISSVAGTGMLGNGHFFVNRLLSIGGSSVNGINGGSAGPGASSGGFFVPNAISYTTPSVNGWSATVLSTTKSGSEGSVVTDPADDNRYTAMSITGSVNAIGLSAAYQNRADTYRTYAASAKYSMGAMTLVGNYMTVRYNAAVVDAMAGVTVDSYGAGIGYDISSALNVGLQYAGNDIAGGRQSLTGAHAKYSLSKRTSVYASYTSATNGAMSAYEGRVYNSNAIYGGNVESNRTVAVGVAHSF